MTNNTPVQICFDRMRAWKNQTIRISESLSPMDGDTLMQKNWKGHYNNERIYGVGLQAQVGRTVNQKVIQEEIWERTLSFVINKMNVTNESVLLDLCCGNGAHTVPMAKLVSSITAVDFSEPLLENLKNYAIAENVDNIKIVNADVNEVKLVDNTYTHALLYFALQHFTELEALLVMESVFGSLNKDSAGIFYIGDIPDRNKLWEFANTNEYVRMYFDRLKQGNPAVGSWFLADDLVKMAKYVGFSTVEVIKQPDWQINSSWRFDLLLRL